MSLISDLKVIERYQILAMEVENRGFTTKQYEDRFAQMPDKQRTLKAAEKGGADRAFMLMTKSGLYFMDGCWAELNGTNAPPDDAKFHCGGIRRFMGRKKGEKVELDDEKWEREFFEKNTEPFDFETLQRELEPSEEEVIKYKNELPAPVEKKSKRTKEPKEPKAPKAPREKTIAKQNKKSKKENTLPDTETDENSSAAEGTRKRKRSTDEIIEEPETFEGEEIEESIPPPVEFRKLENGDDFLEVESTSVVPIPLIPRDCDFYCKNVLETDQGLLFLLDVDGDTTKDFQDAIDVVNKEMEEMKKWGKKGIETDEYRALSVAKRFVKKNLRNSRFRQAYRDAVQFLKELAEKAGGDEWPNREFNNELVYRLEMEL